jgi:hypothetical protein
MPRPGLEPTVRIDICESAVLNHCAINAFCTSRNNYLVLASPVSLVTCGMDNVSFHLKSWYLM